MEWKGKAGSTPVGVISGGVSALWAWERIIGLASLPDDAKTWISMTELIPTPVAAAAMGAFALFAWARWGDKLRNVPPVVIAAGLLWVALLIAVGLLAWFWKDIQPPKFVFTHPTLSVAEQEKAKAECRIAAYNALGSGSGSLKDPTPGNRADYVANCLTAKGFQLKQVDD